MTWIVHCADVLAWCEDYAAKIERGEAEPFMGILTDPPYGLSDTPDMAEVLTHWLAGDDYEHKGGGMMGKSWDSFVPGPAVWAALRRVCHPGAYLFAFGGTRTADLLSVALRLAGWERFDEIDVLGGSVSWIQGSGFPKSTAIGKKVDSAAGMEREVVGEYQYPDGNPRNTSQHQTSRNGIYSDIKTDGSPNNRSITAPATPLATAWQGHGSAMKPAHEPILAFRNPLAKVPSDRIHAVTGWDWWHSEKLLKDTPHTRLKMLKKYGCRLPPLYGDSDLVLITRKALHEGVETDKLLVARAKRQWREAPTEPVTLARVDVKAYQRWSSETYAANCLSTGAGGLWIDGSRVATGEDTSRNNGGCEVLSWGGTYGAGPNEAQRRKEVGLPTQGRWPPNCALVHIPPRQLPDGGWLPGCERLGVKRVRGGPGDYESHRITQKGTGRTMGSGWIDSNNKPSPNGYADPDGLESVTAYACVLACDGCGHQWTAEQRGACPECGGEARWACAVAELGEQSGERKTGSIKPYEHHNTSSIYGNGKGWQTTSGYITGSHCGDTGTCARFFPQFTWQHEIAERLAGVVPFRYVSKAGRRERDAGLSGEKQFLATMGDGIGKREHNPEEPNAWVRNPHPTVKPISLISDFLAKLLLPPPEYAPRRVLVPFAGSGSEMAGCLLAGFDEIVGVEMEQSYVDIARARLRFWTDWAARGYDDPAAILKAAKREETRCEKEQMEMKL